jgi:2-oxoglutarate dehydrogenase complex dehydrogenase (E1) component-like enzyme
MGLRQGDLKNMVYHIMEIDSFASKMGDDKDIVTLSFSVKEKAAAEDLMNFIEKGYEFVLDADITPGEQSDGTHKVFVEIERTNHIHKQVMEVMDGVSKLSEEFDWRFRYYKNWQSTPLELSNLEEVLPSDPSEYNISESNLKNNYKNYFNKSFLEDVNLVNNILTITKKWCDPLQFEFIEFGDTQPLIESIEDKLNVNDFAEIIFLCKYIGDYNITKFGDKLTFENSGKALLLKRLV